MLKQKDNQICQDNELIDNSVDVNAHVHVCTTRMCMCMYMYVQHECTCTCCITFFACATCA